MKYIILERESLVYNDVPVLFPEAGDHSYVANGRPVVSAGYVQIDFENRTCHAYGRSVSLKTEARPEDSQMLKYALFGRD